MHSKARNVRELYKPSQDQLEDANPTHKAHNYNNQIT